MVVGDKQRRWTITFMALIVATLFVLNYPGLLIETPPLTYDLLLPLLLAIGLVGSRLNITALRNLGWVAILGLLPMLLAATPDLDHADPALRGFPTLWRMGVTLALYVALILSFRKLGLKSR